MNPFENLNAEFVDACCRLVVQLEKHRFGAIMLLCLATLVCLVALVGVTSL